MDPPLQTGKKRSLDDSPTDGSLSCPIKRTICDITDHNRKLFLDGENSDIRIDILDKQYFLHKFFLSQSPYFSSMFGGGWLETNKKSVNIEVVDHNITHEALDKVFESLYTGSITITPADVVSVLAAAHMFQLNKVTEECLDIMTEAISRETVLPYYEAGYQYGSVDIEHKCFDWLLLNCARLSFASPDMSLDLVEKLVSHHEFFCENEAAVYNFLKIYVFCKENERLYEPGLEDEYFLSKTGDEPYLSTDEGLKYVPLFEKLRFQFIITDSELWKKIIKDKVMPEVWLVPFVWQNWKQMALKQPVYCIRELSDFKNYCRRMSFYLENDYEFRCPEFRRHSITVRAKSEENKNSIIISLKKVEQLSQYPPRNGNIIIRMTLTKLNSRHQPQNWDNRSKNRILNDLVAKSIWEFEDITFPLCITINTFLILTEHSIQLPCEHT